MDEKRLQEIDIRVVEAGLSYNPNTERFEVTSGSDADNNLDFSLTDALSMLPDDISEEELREYVSRIGKQADDDFYQQEADRLMEEQEEDEPNE